MVTHGVTYVAWGRCIEEAERSAESAKIFGLKTCLIAPSYNGNIFDEFVKTRKKLTIPADKALVHALSPQGVTLYLASETIILGDLKFGFDMALKHGIALAIAPACFARHHWKIKTIPEDLPDYN